MCAYVTCFTFVSFDVQLTGGDHAVDMVEEFESFKQKYQKAYSSAEGIWL